MAEILPIRLNHKSINQSINQSIINQSINQSINPSNSMNHQCSLHNKNNDFSAEADFYTLLNRAFD